MWDGFNKRKFPRLNLRCELILRNRAEDRVLRTQTVNVGAGGFRTILERALERFSHIPLRLELDPGLPWLECQGRVVWVVASRDGVTHKERFDTGIEFMALQPAEQDLIRRYVDARIETVNQRS